MESFVFALAILGLVDSISFMIVMPSLAFYISSLGGSQDYYGFVLSIYSFTSFCGKPVLGRWSDARNFQEPFMASISLSVLGGLFYAVAPAFTNNRIALASVAMGRILGGFGRANSALGFAYVARGCPPNKRTSVTSLLGGVQTIGMAIAPLFSGCLSRLDFSILGLHFDNLNSVGVFIVIINLASQVVIYLYLPDLPTAEDNSSDDSEGEHESWLRMLRSILNNPHIGIPFLTIFTFNFNWQFIETALAPASFDLFDMSPFGVSCILGIMAVLVFIGMALVHALSLKGVSDLKLLLSGLSGNTFAYILLYMLWFRGVGYIAFSSPVFLGAWSFPFIGAPTRSLFSAAVDATPELAGFEGTMQALLSMSSSIGGFTAPGMITYFCLRTPEEVSSSSDGREFTRAALFSPLLSLFVFIVTFMVGEPEEKLDEQPDDEFIPDDENTPLQAISRRRSDGDRDSPTLKANANGHRRKRRNTIMEAARSASSFMTIPFSLIELNGDIIYEDDIIKE